MLGSEVTNRQPTAFRSPADNAHGECLTADVSDEVQHAEARAYNVSVVQCLRDAHSSRAFTP